MKLFYYRAKRKIDEDNLIDLLQKIHFYDDGHIVKVFVCKSGLFLWSSTKFTITEVEKKFPNTFQPDDGTTFEGELLFTNH